MSVFFRPAWRRSDVALESDVRAFWDRLNILPSDIEPASRLDELCAVALDGRELIAVSTAVIREVDFVKCRLAMFRCSVDPNSRRQRMGTQIAVYSRKLLELWSLENPDEKLMGMGTVVQSPDLLDRENRRALLRSTQLALVGYTAADEPIRISWFEHATIANEKPTFGPGR